MHDRVSTFRTSLGWCAIVGCGAQLRALTFGHPNAAAALSGLKPDLVDGAKPSVWNRSLINRITAALEGEPDQFEDVEVDLEHLTPFSRRVIARCRRILWGETCTYGELAAAAGRPGAARAVGRVMSQNRTPLVVPCHRVIGSSGKLVGFSAPQGIKLKRRLLALELAANCMA
ncbi:MAG TPA: methylated-DNA--[protein]-cysteine S-methyltransferase [Pirellulales bacterium]|jgi:methylated-DNA-[protein]-cysteine S-methyltransferase